MCSVCSVVAGVCLRGPFGLAGMNPLDAFNEFTVGTSGALFVDNLVNICDSRIVVGRVCVCADRRTTNPSTILLSHDNNTNSSTNTVNATTLFMIEFQIGMANGTTVCTTQHFRTKIAGNNNMNYAIGTVSKYCIGMID
jgi:hypothetical protein